MLVALPRSAEVKPEIPADHCFLASLAHLFGTLR